MVKGTLLTGTALGESSISAGGEKLVPKVVRGSLVPNSTTQAEKDRQQETSEPHDYLQELISFLRKAAAQRSKLVFCI